MTTAELTHMSEAVRSRMLQRELCNSLTTCVRKNSKDTKKRLESLPAKKTKIFFNGKHVQFTTEGYVFHTDGTTFYRSFTINEGADHDSNIMLYYSFTNPLSGFVEWRKTPIGVNRYVCINNKGIRLSKYGAIVQYNDEGKVLSKSLKQGRVIDVKESLLLSDSDENKLNMLLSKKATVNFIIDTNVVDAYETCEANASCMHGDERDYSVYTDGFPSEFKIKVIKDENNKGRGLVYFFRDGTKNAEMLKDWGASVHSIDGNHYYGVAGKYYNNKDTDYTPDYINYCDMNGIVHSASISHRDTDLFLNAENVGNVSDIGQSFPYSGDTVDNCPYLDWLYFDENGTVKLHNEGSCQEPGDGYNQYGHPAEEEGMVMTIDGDREHEDDCIYIDGDYYLSDDDRVHYCDGCDDNFVGEHVVIRGRNSRTYCSGCFTHYED